MFAQIKAQEQIQYLQSTMGISMRMGGKTAFPSTSANSTPGDQLQLSPTTRMAMQYGMQDMNISGGWVKLKFDADGDISARLSHTVNYSQQVETLNLDFTFTAEELGISSDVFKSLGNQPIQLRLDFSENMIDYKRETTLTVQQSNRTAGEIITDIARALKDVFRQKGDETVEVFLDKEAFEALLGDARTNEMVDNLIALIGIINQMRLHGGPRNHYQIYVSGKGKPVVDFEDKVDISMKSSQVSIQITILPPEEKSSAVEPPAVYESAVSLESSASSLS